MKKSWVGSSSLSLLYARLCVDRMKTRTVQTLPNILVRALHVYWQPKPKEERKRGIVSGRGWEREARAKRSGASTRGRTDTHRCHILYTDVMADGDPSYAFSSKNLKNLHLIELIIDRMKVLDWAANAGLDLTGRFSCLKVFKMGVKNVMDKHCWKTLLKVNWKSKQDLSFIVAKETLSDG